VFVKTKTFCGEYGRSEMWQIKEGYSSRLILYIVGNYYVFSPWVPHALKWPATYFIQNKLDETIKFDVFRGHQEWLLQIYF